MKASEQSLWTLAFSLYDRFSRVTSNLNLIIPEDLVVDGLNPELYDTLTKMKEQSFENLYNAPIVTDETANYQPVLETTVDFIEMQLKNALAAIGWFRMECENLK